MFAIRFSKQAVKARAKMPQSIADRLDNELAVIAADPAAYRGDWKPLQGSSFWRLRVGAWRAICEIIDNELIIYVLKIGPRVQMKIQIIEHNGTPEYAVVPIENWEALLDRLEELEDLHDARAIAAAIAGGEETYPHEFVKRLATTDSHPLKVWREYRRLTLASLAKACGVSSAALSQIENGKRSPSVELLIKLARALACDMEDLIRMDGQEETPPSPGQG
jgi:DNA-binding XRE family transcriptional regulator/mRNA-degrading endonuclease RelE of RelBE toxin-antitoxin system